MEEGHNGIAAVERSRRVNKYLIQQHENFVLILVLMEVGLRVIYGNGRHEPQGKS